MLRKFISIIISIIVFFGVILAIGSVIQAIWLGYSFSDNFIVRLAILFLSFIIASFTYNLLNGEQINSNNE